MFEWQKRVESSSKPSCPVTAFFVSGDGFIFFGLPAPNNGLHRQLFGGGNSKKRGKKRRMGESTDKKGSEHTTASTSI